jgi:hypothetical protein
MYSVIWSFSLGWPASARARSEPLSMNIAGPGNTLLFPGSISALALCNLRQLMTPSAQFNEDANRR